MTNNTLNTWVGIIEYKDNNLLWNYKAIPLNQLTQIRKFENKLLGLEEERKEIWIGKYKGKEYLIISKIKIQDKKLLLPKYNNINKKGIKLEIKGRLRGINKAASFKISYGKIRTQSLGLNIDYSEKPIQTKWGILGLKIYLG